MTKQAPKILEKINPIIAQAARAHDIRNDIAHGNMSESDFESVESMRHRLFDARKISREIIFETINKAERLEKYMM